MALVPGPGRAIVRMKDEQKAPPQKVSADNADRVDDRGAVHGGSYA